MKNLFIASTSYQLLTAFLIAKERLFGESNIIFIGDKISNLIGDLNFDAYFQEVQLLSNSNMGSTYRELGKKDFDRFFFFQENSVFNKYLAVELKKKGTTIILCPDGAKPYATYNKSHELLSTIKDTLKDRKILAKNKLSIPFFILSSYYRYGSFVKIDEVWLQYPELFNSKLNKTKGKIVKLPTLDNAFLKSILSREGEMKLQTIRDAIIYLNQPVHSEVFLKREQEFLKSMIAKFPNKKLLFKMHPSTSKHAEKYWAAHENDMFIKTDLPAEFILVGSQNCILVTPWSTALMHALGTNNEYFYAFDYFKDLNDVLIKQINLINFPHIKSIEVNVD